jgi:hypothetical protein
MKVTICFHLNGKPDQRTRPCRASASRFIRDMAATYGASFFVTAIHEGYISQAFGAPPPLAAGSYAPPIEAVA